MVKQYQQLFLMEGTALKFDDEVLDYIVEKALEYKLGARGLRSLCEAVMMDIMYDLPSETPVPAEFLVTLDYAKEKLMRSTISRLKAA